MFRSPRDEQAANEIPISTDVHKYELTLLVPRLCPYPKRSEKILLETWAEIREILKRLPGHTLKKIEGRHVEGEFSPKLIPLSAGWRYAK